MSKRTRRVPEMADETMTLRVFQDQDYTHMTNLSEGAVISMGSARRHPDDAVNLEIGGVLAMARAFGDVARKAN